MEAVTHRGGVLEVQFGFQRVRQGHAHLLIGLSLLHHVYLTSYALYYMVHLVEAVTHRGGVLEVQFGFQRVRQINAHLLSGFLLNHHVYLTSYALY